MKDLLYMMKLILLVGVLMDLETRRKNNNETIEASN